MPALDVTAAREAGFTDPEIIDFVRKMENPSFLRDGEDKNFDIEQALQSGRSQRDVVDFMAGVEFASDSLIRDIGRGVNVGVSKLAGGSVDAVNAALGLVGVPTSDRPIGGSEQFREEVFGQSGRAFGGTPETLQYESLEDVRPEHRFGAVAGETFGQGVLMSQAIPAVSQSLVRGGAPRLLDPIINSFKNNPKAFMAAETAANFGAAQGTAVSELVAPGDPLVRAGAEVVGGTLNPLALAIKGGRTAIGAAVRGVKTRFSKAAQRQRAEELLQTAVKDIGDDPVRLAKLLESLSVDGSPLTSGQLTGDPLLIALERKLAANHPKFAGQVQEAFIQGNTQLRSQVDDLIKNGSPEALREAAQVRKQYFDGLLGEMTRQADQRMAEATARVSVGGRKNLQEISSNVVRSLETSLTQARSVEAGLWSRINKKARLRIDSTAKVFDKIKSELLPNEKLPNPIGTFNKFIKQAIKQKKNPGTMTSQQLLRLRSRALALSRTARSKGEWDTNRMLMQIADGVLDDISKLPGEAVNSARQYSRTLNDTFSRTFAGDALGTTQQGGKAIAPEVLLERAYAGGGNLADVRFKELGAAAAFGARRSKEFEDFLKQNKVTAAPQSVMGDLEQFMRVMSKEVLEGGKVNPERLRKFVDKNGAIIEMFPGLRQDLSDAGSAQQALIKTQQTVTRRGRATRSAFSKLVQSEDPARVVRDALSSRNPVVEYNSMAHLARRSGPGAQAGLAASTVDAVAKQASGSANYWESFGDAFLNPIARGKPSLLKIMETQGVLTGAEATRLKRLISRGQRVEQSVKTSAALDEVIPDPDAFFELALRLAGANIGGAGVVAKSSGASLVMAGATSKVLRNMFLKVPDARVSDVLMELVRNPRAMAAALRKPKTVKQARDISRQMNAFLINAGLQPFLGEDDTPDYVDQFIADTTSQPQLVQGEGTPSGMGVAAALLRQRSLQGMENANAP